MRSRRLRRIPALPVPETDALQVLPVPLLQPAKGLNYETNPARLPPEYASDGTNMIVRNGAFEPAPGFGEQLDEGIAVDEPMHAVDFVLSTGERYMIRLGIQSLFVLNYQSQIWQQGLVSFSGTLSDRFTFTAWGDKIVISNGVDPVIMYDPVTNVVTTLVNAPRARHYTTWAGRLIATWTIEAGVEYPSRTRWSARNLENTWDPGVDPGAGYEDLMSTPGGNLDSATGVFPLSDVQALLVRSTSIWLMQQTGIAEAPFRFSQMFSEIGTTARHTIRPYVGGIVFLGRDDVYQVGMQGVQRLGGPIRKRIFEPLYNPEAAYAVADWAQQEYLIAVREGPGTDLNTLWRYSFSEQAWSRQSFVDLVRALSFTQYASHNSIDDLAGTIASLGGLINDLGGGALKHTTLYTFRDWGVSREDGISYSLTDQVRSYSLKLQTGVIRAASTIEKTWLHSILLEVERVTETYYSHSITVSWSSDRGKTWSAGFVVGDSSNKKRSWLSVLVGEEREDFILRIEGDSGYPFKLLGIVAQLQRGARIAG